MTTADAIPIRMQMLACALSWSCVRLQPHLNLTASSWFHQQVHASRLPMRAAPLLEWMKDANKGGLMGILIVFDRGGVEAALPAHTWKAAKLGPAIDQLTSDGPFRCWPVVKALMYYHHHAPQHYINWSMLVNTLQAAQGIRPCSEIACGLLDGALGNCFLLTEGCTNLTCRNHYREIRSPEPRLNRPVIMIYWNVEAYKSKGSGEGT